MKKLLICLIAAAAIVCSGCSGKENKSTTDNSSAPAVSSEAEPGKFDFNSAVKEMNICGCDVSLPCTFKELGEGFSYDEPIEDEYQNYMFTTMRFNGQDIGVIYLELRDDKDYDNAQIVSMMLNSNSGATLKGAGIDSTVEELTAALGEDYTTEELYIKYGSEEKGNILVLLNSVTNKPMNITIIMPKEK